MQSNNYVLEVKEIGKIWKGRSREVVALEGCTFNVSPQEFICLLGPSGCGKSTLLEIIAGLVESSSGTVVMNGKPVREASPERGMVFQSHALFPWRTVRENIEFGLEMRRASRSERSNISGSLIDLVGLAGFENALPRELSGGMCQRVAVARALANSPQVLLMDEPFGALDAQTREELQTELVRIWKETRTTVIFVTHSVQEAVILASKVIVMGTRPGHIHEQVQNNLPRPRDVTTSDFGAAMRTVYSALNEARYSRDRSGVATKIIEESSSGP